MNHSSLVEDGYRYMSGGLGPVISNIINFVPKNVTRFFLNNPKSVVSFTDYLDVNAVT